MRTASGRAGYKGQERGEIEFVLESHPHINLVDPSLEQEDSDADS